MNAYLAVNHKPSRCRVKPLACIEELKTLHVLPYMTLILVGGP